MLQLLTTSNCPVKVAKRKSWRFWQLAGNRWQSWNRWTRILGFVVVQEVTKAFGSGRKMNLSTLALGLRTNMAWHSREGRWVLDLLLLWTSGLPHSIMFHIWKPKCKWRCSSELLLSCWRMTDWHQMLDLEATHRSSVWVNRGDAHLRMILLGCFQVGEIYSSFAILRLSQLFHLTDEAPFLCASGKWWGHDGGWNFTSAIACIILLHSFQFCCSENPFKYCKQSW